MNLWFLLSTDCVTIVHCIVLLAGPLKAMYRQRNENGHRSDFMLHT